MRPLLYLPASCALWLSLFVGTAQADTISITKADVDRWVYPFNTSPGIRATAPVFGAVGEEMFDNFDGQFLVGFNTAAAGVAELGPNEAYKILSVKVTATHSSGQFIYDPTFDNYATHLPTDDPDYVADSDSGRPVEIYGAGLRGGYLNHGFVKADGIGGGITGPPTFNEGSPFAFADPTLPGVRNSFAFDPTYGDVSNAIADRLLDAAPFAVGQIDGLTPGLNVPQGVPGVSVGGTFDFMLDVSRADVHEYLASGLENGGLFFTIVSLQETSQENPSNPQFHTANSFDPAVIAANAWPTLELEYEIVTVPEPGTLVLGILGGGALGLCLLRRRRAE